MVLTDQMTSASSNRYVMKYTDLVVNLRFTKKTLVLSSISHKTWLNTGTQYETSCREHVAPWVKLVAPSEFAACFFQQSLSFLYFSVIKISTKQYETPCRRWKRLTSKTCACREHVAPWEKLVAPSEFAAWAFDAYVRRNAELNGSWISWAILHWRIVIPRIVKKKNLWIWRIPI